MKKILSTALCLATLTLSTLPASAATWPDWAQSAKQWGEAQTLSTTFMEEPAATMTRGMAVQLIYESAGRPAAGTKSPFSDGDGPWSSAIHWAYENNILQGTGNGTCQPEQPVTRQQFAAMLHRWADTPDVSGDLLRYNDRGEIAPWAGDAMHWCVSTGILNGRAADRLSPKEAISVAEGVTMAMRLQALPDLTRLKADLSALTAKPRPLGSAGEQEAAAYLAKRLEDMGYQVTLQEYTCEVGSVGSNVIAVRGGSENSDILVVSAHHDSFPTSFGANDNASGAAALLLIAEQLRDVETDTELRFISFTDEENGKNGSRWYVDSLPKSQRDRIVGCIQLDMLGGLGSSGHVVCTTDGASNWLTDLFQFREADLSLIAETASDHATFQLAGVPSVMLTQNGRGYLYHSAGDTADQLNPWAIHRTAGLVSEVVSHIASRDTGSYQPLAGEQADHYVYRHNRQSRIFFSSTRAENEAYLGFTGTLADQWEEVGDFWKDTYEVYEYNMGWFGGEELMPTRYLYRNGYLEHVEIHPARSGYTAEQLVALISSTHGVPIEADEAEGRWNWQDELYGKYITLRVENGEPKVSVFSYSIGISNTLATYDVTSGNAHMDDPRHAKVWDLLCAALPAEHRQKIGQFQLFTDGFSNILAYTSTVDQNSNDSFVISVDYYDVYDEYGDPRDWSKLLFTLIHEYGHVLLENDTQIDLTTGRDIHDPAGFIPGSFRQRYYEAFWQDPYTSYLGSYWEHPEHYVSGYAGNLFHEDIADTFAVFVFGGEPTGDSVAEQKLRFFWEDSGMTALRADIRAGLALG